ncbi:MAG: hypothetical protein IT423_13905 [Pirellulaceae bacterium]|nr:hypothetical protein [Pirellulaceae bacterium]
MRGRDFLWLIRHQLWTAALAAVLYTILPVDYAVHSYNAQQILSGNPAPSTQIPTHETSSEGLIPLVTLLESSDASIRVGIEATLAQWLAETKAPRDWRSQQWVDRVLRDRLRPHMARLAPYVANPELRKARMAEFHAYAYQWY